VEDSKTTPNTKRIKRIFKLLLQAYTVYGQPNLGTDIFAKAICPILRFEMGPPALMFPMSAAGANEVGSFSEIQT
jgi:hypothetical protein